MAQKSLEKIIGEQLSITLLSTVPLDKQEELKTILSTMIGEMFQALNKDNKDPDTILMNSADALEFAGLLFINFSKSIKENEVNTKQYAN